MTDLRISRLTFVVNYARRVLGCVCEDDSGFTQMEARNFLAVSDDVATNCGETADERYMNLYHVFLAECISKPERAESIKAMLRSELAALADV